MPRLFLAIPLPDEVKDRLLALRPPAVPGMRLVGCESMHVTLHFLGEVAQADEEFLRSALANLKANAFELVLRGVGCFPPAGQPRVLWAGVANNPALVELHQSIGAILTDAIGFQPEQRPYAPHVTLARFNAPTAADAVEPFLEKQKNFELPKILVQQFTLYSSVVVEQAPRYEAVAVFRLALP